MFDKLRPLGNRALVKRVKNEERTAGGIYIPDSAQEKAQKGHVVAVGAGTRDTSGNAIPMQVNVGDVVYFGKYSGTEAGDEYLIIREDEILGVIDNS